MLCGMNKHPLNTEELNMLRRAHRKAGSKREADKIKVIYSLAIGHSIAEVASILMIDEDTIRTYQNAYQAGGLTELLKTSHKGGHCRLSAIEIDILKEELETTIHLTTQSVIYFVNDHFEVSYTHSGMRDLLHRIGYEYKKPKLVPGNPDLEAQAFFAEKYEEFMANKPADAEVLFLDAVHPEHNTLAAYGWIKKGQKRELKTNSGRQRLNLHGAINAETYEVTMIESSTVNEDSTMELLSAIEQRYFMASTVYIILDNARYHYSKKVREYLEGKNLKLVFLPSYSPNLNLIERLWHFFKKKVLYNQYHENLDAFRQACIKFFRNIEQHHSEIHNFMSADFDLA